MEKHNPMELRKKIESKLIEKVWKDEEFKNSLREDAAGTLTKELGFKIPDNIRIKVIEETAEEVYLVIPQNPAESRGELTDSELDGVAGGEGTYLCTQSCENCGYP